MSDAVDNKLKYLQQSLARISPMIENAVARMRTAPHPQDSLRGLIITDDEINAAVSDDPLKGLWSVDDYDPNLSLSLPDNPDEPFLQLVDRFDLNIYEAYIILLCLAPDVDRRYERIYGYLQDNVTEPFPTVNLMMNLLGENVPQRFTVRESLQSHSTLVKQRLVKVAPNPNNAHLGFLSWHVRLDPHIANVLLGFKGVAPIASSYLAFADSQHFDLVDAEDLQRLTQHLSNAPIIFIDGDLRDEKVALAGVACQQAGQRLLVLNMPHPDTTSMPIKDICQLAYREAVLHQAVLFVQDWENCLDDNLMPLSDWWQQLCQHTLPVILCGQNVWEPQDTDRARRMVRITMDKTPISLRYTAWEHACQQHNLKIEVGVIEQLASQFRFSPQQVTRAVLTAMDVAYTEKRAVIGDDLFYGARSHSHLRLGQLAQRLAPRHDWDDLILPPDQLDQLQEMQSRAQYSGIVTEEWGFGKKHANATGISALFAGESGTGKTLAAEVIAKSLGMIIYKIDLSSVVSKYIGETEKNLNVIFTEAQSSNAILFFDEADALFGKRSEVKDARDRYSNIEVAYLLQKIEEYDGIAIMATNLRQNLDEAFTRRLDFLIDFPFPEAEYRERIWKIHFTNKVQISPDIDLRYFAKRYNLAGGNIKNVVLAAAFLAAADDGTIRMRHLHHAVRREHQKLGRLFEEDHQGN